MSHHAQAPSRRRKNRIILISFGAVVLFLILIAVIGTMLQKPAPKLSDFGQCVAAYEAQPNEDAQQIVPATPACRVIPLGQAEVTALFDASHHDNPATARP
jgi:hypothetical protein